MKKLAVILLTSLSIVSCSNKIKQKIGVATTGPDEYQVQRMKSLEVPPNFNLNPPLEEEETNPQT